MVPEPHKTRLKQLEAPAGLDAEARQQFLALVAAYEELGHSHEEALGAALRRIEERRRARPSGGAFPTFQAAAWRTRGLGRRLWPVAASAMLVLLLASVVTNEIAGRALERELAAV